MANKTSGRRVYKPSYRKYRAYRTALLVSGSYLMLGLKRRILGKTYYRKKLQVLHVRNANRVNAAILELQGLFIKFGQLISILSNVLPEQFREPLAALQDKVPPRPYEEVAETFFSQTGKKIPEIFEHFEETPIAAASIGQVHRARLNGEEYVVKIQHSDIEAIAGADLSILKRLVAIHAFFMDMKGMDYVYEQVKEMIRDELDYQKEAASMKRLSAALAGEQELRVVVPEVYPKIGTQKILVSRFCRGENISRIAVLDEWGIDRRKLAERLLILYSKMILVDGFYHADPHPGNILINKDGEIILLDYGAVAEISPVLRAAIPELIEAVIKNNTEETVAALKKMGFITSDKEAVRIAEHMIQVFRGFLQDEVKIDGMNLASVSLNSGFGSLIDLLKQVSLKDVSRSIQIPKDYVLLNRTVVLLLGLSFQLDPGLNPLDTVRPYLKKHLGPDRKGIAKMVLNAIREQAMTAMAIPRELHKYLKHANRGELEFEIKGLKESLTKIYFLGQQLVFLLAAAISFYFISLDAASPLGKYTHWLWIAASAFAFLFFRAWWKGEKND